jgi:hypothetical protein
MWQVQQNLYTLLRYFRVVEMRSAKGVIKGGK